MCRDFKWDDSYRPDRGKVLSSEDLDKLESFRRYLDVDHDGIPYRTLPGTNPKGAYFARGSGHNQYGGYTEDATEYQAVVDRLIRKFETAPRYLPKPVLHGPGNREIGLISIGSCDGAIHEAIDVMRRQGVMVDYLRVRAFPFHEEVEAFMTSHSTVFVVEQNRDAQLKSLLMLETEVERRKLRSILHYNGMPISSRYIVEGVIGTFETATARVASG
jgi:2-oxoglutarate ferredoxin oxidoreductase subunit alpha